MCVWTKIRTFFIPQSSYRSLEAFSSQQAKPDSLSGHAQEMSTLSGANTGPEPDLVAMAAGRQDHRE